MDAPRPASGGGSTSSPDAQWPVKLGVNRAPILHVFGHVHAKQWEDEDEAGPRFLADSSLGMLFLNCAAEKMVCAYSCAEPQPITAIGRLVRLPFQKHLLFISPTLVRHQIPTISSAGLAGQQKRVRAAEAGGPDDSTRRAARKLTGKLAMGAPAKHTTRAAQPGVAGADPKDSRLFLRPPVVLRVPLEGRLVEHVQVEER